MKKTVQFLPVVSPLREDIAAWLLCSDQDGKPVCPEKEWAGLAIAVAKGLKLALRNDSTVEA